MFEKYNHVETLGSAATQGILNGICYVFEKMDDSNGSIWLDDSGNIKAGSRNRELSEFQDNYGFYKYVQSNNSLKIFLEKFPKGTIAYGEWMIPHTIKDYPQSYWNTFRIFDVKVNGKFEPFDEWVEFAEGLVDYVPLVNIFHHTLTSNRAQEIANTYSEGVIVKNYDFINKFKNQCSAKVISSSFYSKKGVKQEYTIDNSLEFKIVKKYLTTHLIYKSKDKLQCDELDRKKLINLIWYDFINEELFDILEKERNPAIDFKRLKSVVVCNIKYTLPELF